MHINIYLGVHRDALRRDAPNRMHGIDLHVSSRIRRHAKLDTNSYSVKRYSLPPRTISATLL